MNVKQLGRDIFNGCETIIPYSYSIRSSSFRINKIIGELKRLKVDQYPNACGALLRLLFELSAKALLEKIYNNDETTTDFKTAVTRAANELRKKKSISDQQHSAIIKDADSLRLIFNGYMHDTDSYPSTEGLKNYFKAHHVFIEKCINYSE